MPANLQGQLVLDLGSLLQNWDLPAVQLAAFGQGKDRVLPTPPNCRVQSQALATAAGDLKQGKIVQCPFMEGRDSTFHFMVEILRLSGKA